MKTSSYLVLFSIVYLVLSGILFVKIPSFQTRMEIDSPAYTSYTECFEEHGAFIKPGETKCTNWFSIGYPMFMVGVRSIFGNNYLFVILLQILLGIFIIGLVFRLSSYFFSRKVSLLAAFLASINLAFILYPHFILTESLLCFVYLFAFERFVAYLFEGKWHQIGLSGLIFGLSIIVKSAAIYFMIFLAGFLFIWGSRFFLKNIKAVLLFLLCFFIPVFGFVLRNKSVYGYYYLKSVDKVNLYHFYLPQILQEEGLSEDEASAKVHSLMNVKEFASGEGWEKVHELFIQKVSSNPVLAIKIWLKNVMKTFMGLYTNHLKVILYTNIRGGDCSYFYYSGSWYEKAWSYLSFGTESKFLIGLGIFEAVWDFIRYLFVLIGLFYLLLRRKFLWAMLFSVYIFYFSPQ